MIENVEQNKSKEQNLLNQLLPFSLERITQKLARSTIQFFAYKSGTKIPVGSGSGVLIKRDSDHFIFTSAHVIADGKIDSIFINLKGQRSLNLNCPYLCTEMPSTGKRDDDLMDVGILFLRADQVEEITNIGGYFTDSSFIKLNHCQDKKDSILTLGFPANKLKLDFPGNSMQQSYMAYPNNPAITYKSKNGRVTSENHVLIPYERKNLKSLYSTDRIMGPYPHGMSGGGMWLLKEVKPLLYSANLVGIVNEINYKRSYFIGTKIDFHVQSLNTYYDQLKDRFN